MESACSYILMILFNGFNLFLGVELVCNYQKITFCHDLIFLFLYLLREQTTSQTKVVLAVIVGSYKHISRV